MNERPLVEELGSGAGSPYRRYLRIFVGRPSLAAFLRYELITGLLGPMPGAAGFFLCSRCYPWLLESMWAGTAIDRSVTLGSRGGWRWAELLRMVPCNRVRADARAAAVRCGSGGL